MKSRNFIWAITVAVVTALVISAKLARRMRPYQQRKGTQRANQERYFTVRKVLILLSALTEIIRMRRL